VNVWFFSDHVWKVIEPLIGPFAATVWLASAPLPLPPPTPQPATASSALAAHAATAKYLSLPCINTLLSKPREATPRSPLCDERHTHALMVAKAL
jgi:hypothetical protein